MAEDKKEPWLNQMALATVILAVFYGPLLGVFALADLDGSNDGCHVVVTASLAAGPASDKAFINFDGVLAANAIAFRSNHTRAELVKDLEGRFIPGET